MEFAGKITKNNLLNILLEEKPNYVKWNACNEIG